MSRQHTFWARLKRALPTLRTLAAREEKTLTINAHFGQYELKIGQEYTDFECRKRAIPAHSRPIELNGTIDHLYIVEGEEITPHPSQNSVDNQLGSAVIIRGVTVHIFDKNGDGQGISRHREDADITIQETMILRADNDTNQLEKLHKSGQLTASTYKIMQEDIIRMLREVGIERSRTDHRFN